MALPARDPDFRPAAPRPRTNQEIQSAGSKNSLRFRLWLYVCVCMACHVKKLVVLCRKIAVNLSQLVWTMPACGGALPLPLPLPSPSVYHSRRSVHYARSLSRSQSSSRRRMPSYGRALVGEERGMKGPVGQRFSLSAPRPPLPRSAPSLMGALKENN